jgi:anti-sigma B factor antagonist
MTATSSLPNTTLSIAAPAEITASSAQSFRKFVLGLYKAQHVDMDLDMRSTTFIDSSGLGSLISLHKHMAERGGRIKLLNPRQSVLQLLELTRMHKIFEIQRA